MHEDWIVDGGDVASQVVHLVEELGRRFDTEGGGEPDPVEHRDQVGPHRPGEQSHGVDTPERVLGGQAVRQGASSHGERLGPGAGAG
jgi:hypothetical protein